MIPEDKPNTSSHQEGTPGVEATIIQRITKTLDDVARNAKIDIFGGAVFLLTGIVSVALGLAILGVVPFAVFVLHRPFQLEVSLISVGLGGLFFSLVFTV